ncbi:3'-5' exonuclease [Clostridium sp. ZS2-4]|uniref:3'-5' exonuclease n=1 Tax=Clostridium sp. ZS2-4 TaxID=2987703 RepID=UPI00227B8627|nr:3'-5' exonuclease [Clostridium sp. ZS2-4]MCY6354314.1 exonuclease domain-containing protein [Clostridium sp. ZS2-4]
MNYIIFDLEFNQGYNYKKGNKNITIKKCPFEIIQVGAVKIDEDFQIISTLNRLIKPKIYTDIHPFVKEITGITIEQLKTAKTFNEIYEEFIEFVKGERNVFGVWGVGDMKELFRNIEYHELCTSLIPKEYINIQSYASKYLNCPKGTNVGLRNAVELLNIDIKEQFHDALNDAYYTAEIFKKIYNETIKFNTYDPHKRKKLKALNNGKKKIDTYRLIKQFEKMFKREMSTEEKEIIKLAYMMGKTNQFQIVNNANER